MCIDGRLSPDRQRHIGTIAWCVGQDSFVKIAIGPRQTVPSTVKANYNAVKGISYSVEILLTSLDSEKVMEARNLDIEALTFETYRNIQSWRTLSTGLSQCKDCASVGIKSVPERANKIEAHVELKEDTERAVLYLVGLPVS